MVGALVGLLVEEGAEGTFGENLSGGQGERFHLGEGDIEAGAFGAEGVAGNHFAPCWASWRRASCTLAEENPPTEVAIPYSRLAG